MKPIIFRFAQRIPAVSPDILRYDTERQITQILDNGYWIDRLTVTAQGETTRFTKVNAETTDDE